VPEWAYRVCVAVGAALLVLPAVARTPRFFYIDDTQSQGLPSMALVGRSLRQGEWRLLYSELGAGGNLAVDPQYGMFFPPKLLLSLIASFFDDVRLVGTAITAAFLAFACLGVVTALRAAGAARGWSLAAGLAFVTSGFVYVWAAAAWHPALWAFSMLPWLWWSLIQHRPWVRVVGSALTGWFVVGFAFPFAALCAAVLALAWAAVEVGTNRRWATAASALLGLGSGAALGAINYLPILGAADYTTRYGGLRNDDFLVPNLADMLSSWSPVTTSEVAFWGGPISQSPLTFMGWFAVPVLALVSWQSSLLRSARVREMLLLLAVMLLFTQLPSEVGPFRWPFRFIPAVALALNCLVVLIIAHSGLKVTRGRLLGVSALVGAGAWIQFGRSPQDLKWILAAVALEAVLLSWLVVSVRRRRGGGWVAVGGSFAALGLLVIALPAPGTNPDVPDWGYAPRVSQVPAPPVAPESPALVLRTPATPIAQDLEAGMTVGFVPTYHERFVGQSYTAVGHKALAQALCSDYLGRSCPAAQEFLLSQESSTGRPWLELLGYQGLLFTQEFPGFQAGRDWQALEPVGHYSHLKRVKRQRAPHVTWTSPEVRAVEVLAESANGLTLRVDADPGARLILDQLWWPGWKVDLDGSTVEAADLEGILVAVDLPEGSSGLVSVRYQPVSPWLLVAWSLGVAVLLSLAAIAARSSARRQR